LFDADGYCSSALKVAEMDLAAAKGHVQQFQEISQANESAFASLTATHDEYKSHIEAQMALNEVSFFFGCRDD
jgi:nucleoprotein TPR